MNVYSKCVENTILNYLLNIDFFCVIFFNFLDDLDVKYLYMLLILMINNI